MGNTTPQVVGDGATSTRTVPRWTLGDRLRKIRREIGADQKLMAEKLGIDKASYANWEYDRSLPRNLVSVASRIELMTGVPAEWLLGLPAPEPNTPNEKKAEEAEREEIVQRILAATLRAQGGKEEKPSCLSSAGHVEACFVSPSGLIVTERDAEQVKFLTRHAS